MPVIVRCLPLLALCLTGCRGPSLQEISAFGLTGAFVFALMTWGIVTGFARLWVRVREGAWQPAPAANGWPVLLGVHAVVSVVGATQARFNDGGIMAITWACAAAHHLALGLLIWRFTRTAPPWAALWAGVLSLTPAIFGAFDLRAAGEWTVLIWLWGGLMGAVPAGVAVLLLIEARLGRARSPHP